MISNSLITTASFAPDSFQLLNAWIIQEVSPKIFVELGTHSGNAYLTFCQAVFEAGISTKCYAVNTWQGDEQSDNINDDDEIFAPFNAYHQKHYAKFSRLLRMTVDDAVTCFADESIDLLNIDGLHTYEAACHDFETWLPKLAPGAVVVFPHTNVHERNFGVWKLWKELQACYPNNLEIMHSDGLGILQLNNASDNKKLEWLQSNSPEKQQIISYFAALDSRQLENLKLNELMQPNVNLNQAIAERDRKIDNLSAAIEDYQTSTSWRITKPLRLVVGKTKVMWELLGFLTSHPRKITPTLNRLRDAKRDGGWTAVKRTIRVIPLEIGHDEVWRIYSKAYSINVVNHVIEKLSHMKSLPLISILLPAFALSREVLVENLDSVVAQLYPNWELCFAGDGSTLPYVRQVLEDYARRDSRIRVSFNDDNFGAALVTNRALAMAYGDYVVLLDDNVRLEKQALFRVAESVIFDAPDMIYTDEALLSEDGKDVVDFVFRPAFSLELLRSHPYIEHMVAFRTALLRELGGLDETLQISQEYDLILRIAEKSHTIVHIPEVLYLSRQLPDLASQDKQEQVMEASKIIIRNHLLRSGEIAEVSLGSSFNFFDIRYPLQNGLRVAIIIPTKNHGELVRQCVESIERTVQNISYDIIVIDHESDKTADIAYFEELGHHHQVVRYSGPFNFSAINNWAVTQLKGGYSHYLFCNNDVEAIEEGWLTRMLELGQKPDVGIVGATLFYPDGHTYQHAGVCVGMYGAAEHFGKFMDKYQTDGRINPGYGGSLITNHELSAVTAACLLMRRDLFEAIGGFDASLPVGFGDVDLCLRTRKAGYRVIQCSRAALHHHESYTRGKDSGGDPHPQDTALFRKYWNQFIEAGDPFFNPNLDPDNSSWHSRKHLIFNPEVRRRIFDAPANMQVRP